MLAAEMAVGEMGSKFSPLETTVSFLVSLSPFKLASYPVLNVTYSSVSKA